jgi:hypothetical protein
MSKNLSFEIIDFSEISENPKFILELRELTLHSYSAMNFILTDLLFISKSRKPKCKIILCYDVNKLVAWALSSKESCSFPFMNSSGSFSYKKDGLLFQAFVKSSHRRKGIGSEFMKLAQKMVRTKPICICPWDSRSSNFYSKFESMHHKKL